MPDILLDFLDKLTRLNQLAINRVDPTRDIGPMYLQTHEIDELLAPYGYRLVDFPAMQCFVPVQAVRVVAAEKLTEQEQTTINAANGQDKTEVYSMGALDGYKQCTIDIRLAHAVSSFAMRQSIDGITRMAIEQLYYPADQAREYASGYIAGYAVRRGEERRKNDATRH